MIDAGERVTVWIEVQNGEPARRTGKLRLQYSTREARDGAAVELTNSQGNVIIPGNKIIFVEEDFSATL